MQLALELGVAAKGLPLRAGDHLSSSETLTRCNIRGEVQAAQEAAGAKQAPRTAGLPSGFNLSS